MMIVPLKPTFSSGIFQRHNIPLEWLVFISPNNNIYTYIYICCIMYYVSLYIPIINGRSISNHMLYYSTYCILWKYG